MKALVGLGNPGPEYSATRHNVGYRVAELFSARRGVKRFHHDGAMLAARVRFGGEEVLVVKPLTYMNESGVAVKGVVNRHRVKDEDLLVAHDDLDLPLGAVRIKLGGGHGGHNGLRSILDQAAAGEFVRIRLGIQRPDRATDAARWVLEPFASAEREPVEAMIERGADAVDAVLRAGARRAMNEFNRRRQDPPAEGPGGSPHP